MLEISEKPKRPIYLKILRVILIIVTSIMMLIYLYSAVFYVISGPSFTLVEDTTTEFLIQTILLGLSLFFMILAWFKHIIYGIISSVFTVGFLVYTRYFIETEDLGLMPWVLLICSVSFVIMGLIIRHREHNMSDILNEPLKEKFDGPDVYKFGLK